MLISRLFACISTSRLRPPTRSATTPEPTDSSSSERKESYHSSGDLGAVNATTDAAPPHVDVDKVVRASAEARMKLYPTTVPTEYTFYRITPEGVDSGALLIGLPDREPAGRMDATNLQVDAILQCTAAQMQVAGARFVESVTNAEFLAAVHVSQLLAARVPNTCRAQYRFD